MPKAIEQIVSLYVQLKDRRALLELRAHRQRLIVDLNKLRPGSNYDFSLALGKIREDLAAIDAGVAQLEEEGGLGLSVRPPEALPWSGAG